MSCLSGPAPELTVAQAIKVLGGASLHHRFSPVNKVP
jgi:hypothetical protein